MCKERKWIWRKINYEYLNNIYFIYICCWDLVGVFIDICLIVVDNWSVLELIGLIVFFSMVMVSFDNIK